MTISQTDPEAAKVVFEAGAPLTMVPLEVTHTALVTPAVLERLCREPTPFLEIVRKLLLFFANTCMPLLPFLGSLFLGTVHGRSRIAFSNVPGTA
jgi:inosine-uridine nucleoside N-ribohydrolase